LLEPAGRIRRLAAAILVDDAIETKTDGGKAQENRRKRTPEEMKQIEELAKAAIGFDLKRGDQFSLQNISFAQPVVDLPEPPGRVQRWLTFAERWTGVLRYAALLALFALAYLLILRPVKKQVLQILKAPTPGALPAAPGAAAALSADANGNALVPEAVDGSSMETTHAVALKKHLVDKVKENPEGAGRLIQNWIREPMD
jgi:flagellar M-ring protein FliF